MTVFMTTVCSVPTILFDH